MAEIYYKGKQQVFENTPYRGYLSTVQGGAHFGVDSFSVIDSVVIRWPGKMQVFTNVQVNQNLLVYEKNAQTPFSWYKPATVKNALFTEVSQSLNADIQHEEFDFIDFNIQRLLPHKLSEYGPALSVGDVNGDSLQDVIMGGAYGYSAQILLQQPNGKFLKTLLINKADKITKPHEDMGILLFDADNDNDLDLYIASGGFENEENDAGYKDQFYVNDGKGKFTPDTLALPPNYTSKSCVRAADFDHDGDLDLFIAGRSLPWKYPMPVSSFILRNDSETGKIKFTDVSASVAPALKNIGMTCDALWTDFNNDGWVDLVLTGEFMPVRFFKNTKGKLSEITTSLGSVTGWYNSIVPGDFDNDGDIDFVAGNTGSNSFYRPSEKYPVRIYAGDFDNNGSFDAIPTVYLPAEDGSLKEFSAQTRDDMIKQMIEFRRKFENYKSFASTPFDKMLDSGQLKSAYIATVTDFKSCYIRNDGDGKFTLSYLPLQAQLSSIFAMVAEDVDGDGNLDVILNGNDYGIEVSVGRYDALNGLVLKGDGKGSFKPLTMLQSGIFIPGNGKALASFNNANGDYMVAATQNRGSLKMFRNNTGLRPVPVKNNETYAIIHFKNGETRKTELYFGVSFLSQSGRSINVYPAQIKDIEIYNINQQKRVITQVL